MRQGCKEAGIDRGQREQVGVREVSSRRQEGRLEAVAAVASEPFATITTKAPLGPRRSPA